VEEGNGVEKKEGEDDAEKEKKRKGKEKIGGKMKTR